jgi:hypothetical protein
MAGVREVVGAVRLARTRYLRAWRPWRYDPRYRRAASGKQIISFIEPVRLWWRGELDDYVGRPLTEASRAPTGRPAPSVPCAQQRRVCRRLKVRLAAHRQDAC